MYNLNYIPASILLLEVEKPFRIALANLKLHNIRNNK